MKKILLTATLIALPLTLSACDKASQAPKPEATTNAQTGSMGEMATPTGPKQAKGRGTVTAIDMAAGKITLDHEPIPSVKWPAMKMGFTAKRDVLEAVEVGDKVAFDVNVTENAGEVTAIKKQ